MIDDQINAKEKKKMEELIYYAGKEKDGRTFFLWQTKEEIQKIGSNIDNYPQLNLKLAEGQDLIEAKKRKVEFDNNKPSFIQFTIFERCQNYDINPI